MSFFISFLKSRIISFLWPCRRLSDQDRISFKEEEKQLIRERSGVVILLAIFGILVFILSDWVYFPDYFFLFLSIRIFVCLTFSLLFFLNGRGFFHNKSLWLSFFCFYLCIFFMVFILLLSEGYKTSYYAGFLMIFVVFSSVMALPPYILAPHLFLSYFLYMLILGIAGNHGGFLYFFASYILMFLTILGCIVGSAISSNLRIREFLVRQELSEAKDKLERQAEVLTARVSESRNRYRQLVEGMNDCFAVYDENGRVVYINERFCELLSYSKEELLSCSFLNFVKKEEHLKVKEEFKGRQKGRRSAYEISLIDKFGSVIPVIVSAEAMFDENRLFKGSFAVVTDISLQKEMERALRASSERLRAILDATSDAVMLLDPEGRILDINASALIGLERDIDSLTGVSVENLWDMETFARRFPVLGLVFESGEKFEFEDQHKGKTYLHSIYPLKSEKKVSAVALYSRDITDLKKAERRIVLLTHELLRALENERHRISRDLHDHVAQDLSSLRILCQDLASMLEPKSAARRQASHISRRIQDIIKDLREIAYALRPPDLDNLGLTRTLYRYCQEFTENTGIFVNFIAGGMETAPRDFDREINIYRLVQEALNNIRKHALATRVELRLIASYPELIVRISDNGVGFDPQTRENPSYKRGMGLKSMSERVALLGGSFELSSRPSEGCKISVRIPIEEEEVLLTS